MDAGIHLPLIDFGGEGFSHRRLTETVDAARECGFAAISANDHFLFPAPWLDGPTALAAVAERSGGMKLVTSLALATLRGPVPLAKMFAALDILSDGRVIAGLGPARPRPTTRRWERRSENGGRASTRRFGCSKASSSRRRPRRAVPTTPRPRPGSPLCRGSPAASRSGSEAGVRRQACAASPGSAMAGSPPPTTPPRRPLPRP